MQTLHIIQCFLQIHQLNPNRYRIIKEQAVGDINLYVKTNKTPHIF